MAKGKLLNFVFIVLSKIGSALEFATLLLAIFLLSPKLLLLFHVSRSNTIPAILHGGRDYILKMAVPWLHFLPPPLAGRDRADWVLVGISVIFTLSFVELVQRLHTTFLRRKLEDTIRERRRSATSKGESSAGLASESGKVRSAHTMSRKELLKVFAETKRNLDKFGREVAMLSIDIVGSTEMKVNEDPDAVQFDFEEYRKLVEGVFSVRGVLKTAWTPDGVMACFSNVDDAVQAAKDVINSLEAFNKTVKLTKKDFAVRCGVNAGLVYFDDAAPLETISDRVIDVAGHMQKHTAPNTIAVARKLIEPSREANDFKATSLVVDGYEVSEWRH